MKDQTYSAVVELDTSTGLYVGFVPDLPGANTRAESLEELRQNLIEVVGLVLSDAGELALSGPVAFESRGQGVTIRSSKWAVDRAACICTN